MPKQPSPLARPKPTSTPIKKAFGLFKTLGIPPVDGVAYQNQLRDEWHTPNPNTTASPELDPNDSGSSP